jgi:hypothetical protein
MASSDNTNAGGMSVREAGKRGGDRVKAKYGGQKVKRSAEDRAK